MFSREETLKKAYVLLTLFNRDNDSFRLTQPLLSVLNYLDAGSPEDIAALRTEIKSWIKNNPQMAARTIDNVSLHDVLHSFLIAMAAAKPINSEDPVTQDAVAELKRIVTSDGYQFDAESLLTWIKTKGKMINPLTNLIFAEKDQYGIIAYAAEKKIDIAHAYSAPEQEDPGLLRSALATLDAEQIRNSHHGRREGFAAHDVEMISLLPRYMNSLPRNPNGTQNIYAQGIDALVERQSRSEGLGFSYSNGSYFPLDPNDLSTLRFASSRIATLFGSQQNVATNRREGFTLMTGAVLRRYGLTLDFIRIHWQGTEDFFGNERANLLFVYLVNGRDPSTDRIFRLGQALTEEQRLTPAQAIDEMNGLTGDELQILGDNYAYGLRKNHLLMWRSTSSGINLTRIHSNLLNVLFREQYLSPDEAIQQIRGLTASQAINLHSDLVNDALQRRSTNRPV